MDSLREWASHMSVLFLLHQLVENYSENSEMLTNVDWVVVPVVNPDGYAYTFTNVIWKNVRASFLIHFYFRIGFGEKIVGQSMKIALVLT